MADAPSLVAPPDTSPGLEAPSAIGSAGKVHALFRIRKKFISRGNDPIHHRHILIQTVQSRRMHYRRDTARLDACHVDFQGVPCGTMTVEAGSMPSVRFGKSACLQCQRLGCHHTSSYVITCISILACFLKVSTELGYLRYCYIIYIWLRKLWLRSFYCTCLQPVLSQITI
jgi:hypothetical protein